MKNIHIITLGVQDLKKAEEFYTNVFNWRRSGASTDGVIFFDTGNITVCLYPWNALAEDAKVGEGTQGFRGITLAYNVNSEKEVEEFLAKAIEFGATQIKEPQKASWGGYHAYFTDPDAHLWEVAMNPYFEINQDGNLKIP
jgi:catechol 2,3-dioxygenase-like lactoylglutathione lyase family enzyme